MGFRRIHLPMVLFSIILASDAYQVPLNGHGWALQLQDESVESVNWTISDVKIPGDVYLHLFKAGRIEDPYYGDNDVKLRWIGFKNWTYSKIITFTPEYLSKQSILLRADGLDTVVDIYLNNHSIGQGTNMFREYLFNIPQQYLNLNGNQHLQFKFKSTVPYAATKFREHKEKKGYSVGLECRSKVEHGECHANFVRKMQASYGWDWGPAFPTMGIWKPVSIEIFEICYLKRFSVVPEKSEAGWALHSEFFLYCNAQVNTKVEFCVRIDELDLKECWKEKIFQLEPGPKRIYRKIDLNSSTQVDLWWPNGLGLQRLYEVVGIFRAGEEKSYEVLKIGFRHVQLIEEPVRMNNIKVGLTFYVKLNDVPVFLKGGNWIPGDSFQTRLNEDPDRLEFLFSSMRQANMNCIRVWGGGVYESDRFYSLADRYGITIFHDMMFAVDLYPATLEFLSNVKAEIEDQVNRLKHHPSIIFWAGNNENELGLTGNWYSPMDTSFETYKEDYMALYNSTIYGVINETDFHTRPYVLSSPSNGRQTIREGGLSSEANSNLYGDVHFYTYNGDSWDWKTYPTPRCATEYGFLSMPSMETLRQAMNDSDLDYFGPQMKNRQHHDDGSDMLSGVLSQFDFFGCNSLWSSDEQKCNFTGRRRLEDIIYLSQIYQAMAYKTETEHYRRWRSMVNDRGEGRTMCALYWQLNDIWQAPTWSSIDFGLKWKAAHYEAKRFFSPLIVSPYVDKEKQLKVVAVNDLREDTSNLTLVIRALSWDSFKPLAELQIPIGRVNATSSSVIYETPVSKFSEDVHIGILDFVLTDSETKEETTPHNVMLLESVKSVSHEYFGRVVIDGVHMEGSKVARVDLLATGIAPWVWLDVAGIRGFFSDNSFIMTTKRRSVRFIAWENVSLEEISDKITVKTLGDIYRNEKS